MREDIEDNICKFVQDSVLSNEDLISIAKSILNSDVYIHQSRINYKAGKDANGWNIHSDFETWHSKDGMPQMDCFTAVVAINENTVGTCFSRCKVASMRFILELVPAYTFNPTTAKNLPE